MALTSAGSDTWPHPDGTRPLLASPKLPPRAPHRHRHHDQGGSVEGDVEPHPIQPQDADVGDVPKADRAHKPELAIPPADPSHSIPLSQQSLAPTERLSCNYPAGVPVGTIRRDGSRLEKSASAFSMHTSMFPDEPISKPKPLGRPSGGTYQ